MKSRTALLGALVALSADAFALNLKEFTAEEHAHHADYQYAEGRLLFYPHSFRGFELRASYPVRANVAITGYLDRLSREVVAGDLTRAGLGIGGRYFFALPQLERTDLDLSLMLTNTEVDTGSGSSSDAQLVLGAQARHLWQRQIGASALTLEETSLGFQLAVGDDGGTAAHLGAVIGVNAQFSAVADVLIDDGSHVSFGVRMKLGRSQRNPEAGVRADRPAGGVDAERRIGSGQGPQSSSDAASPATPPVLVAPSQTRPGGLQAQPLDPHGLTEDEMADFQSSATADN